MTPSPLLPLFVAATESPFDSTWSLFKEGGFFMFAIAACSVVALMVVVLKLLTLARGRVVPTSLGDQVEALADPPTEGSLERLRAECQASPTSLGRLCLVVLANLNRDSAETKEAVQSTAREEIVRMSMGLAILDVILTIAPLLGLLGTASGLVVVFREVGVSADSNWVEMANGIARALSTTIAGVAVAVPSVIAHSFFSRKIESMTARLEVRCWGTWSQFPTAPRAPPETMEFPRTAHTARQVPIIPLIDILAILLIFFIVSSAPKRKRNVMKLSLPTVENLPTAAVTDARVVLAVNKEGRVTLDGAPVPAGFLVEYFEIFIEKNPGGSSNWRPTRGSPSINS